MLLCEQPAKAPKDSNLNPQATEQQQSVCIQNFASPSDLNLRFQYQLLSGWIVISDKYTESSECCENERLDFHQPSSLGWAWSNLKVEEASIEQPGNEDTAWPALNILLPSS